MTIFNVERVIIKYLNENGSYSAISHVGNQLFNDCIFLTPYPNIVAYEMIGKHALLITIDNQNFILGYYIDEYEVGKDTIYLEGETLFKMGEARGIIVGDDGYIGVYEYRRDANGRITRIPKLEYNAKDEVYATFTSMLASMSDSSAEYEISKDTLGYNKATFSMKGKNVDKGERYRHSIKSGPAGIESETLVDLTPGPLRTIPVVPIDALPKSLSIKSSPTSPLSIMYMMAGIPNVSIKIGTTGEVTIKTGAAGEGAQIILDPIKPNAVVIKSNAAGMGTITMKKTGSILIDAKAGIEIKGSMVGLLATLSEFIQNDYATHFHPSAMGPTGAPLPMAGAPTNIKLKTIKGK